MCPCSTTRTSSTPHFLLFLLQTSAPIYKFLCQTDIIHICHSKISLKYPLDAKCDHFWLTFDQLTTPHSNFATSSFALQHYHNNTPYPLIMRNNVKNNIHPENTPHNRPLTCTDELVLNTTTNSTLFSVSAHNNTPRTITPPAVYICLLLHSTSSHMLPSHQPTSSLDTRTNE